MSMRFPVFTLLLFILVFFVTRFHLIIFKYFMNAKYKMSMAELLIGANDNPVSNF